MIIKKGTLILTKEQIFPFSIKVTYVFYQGYN